MQTCSQICRYRGWAGSYRKMARSNALDNELSSMFGEAT